MGDKRTSVLQHWMGVVEIYTIGRALDGLTQEEFEWEPHPGAWGVRRRSECTTPDATGDPDGEWVSDNDDALAEAVDRGEAVSPMTTIGWLLNHVGAGPGMFAELTIVGGPVTPTLDGYHRMWGHTNFGSADEAVARFRDGWTALQRALWSTTDEMLEQDYPGHPWRRGDHALGALLNEISHHLTQVCTLRDFYAHR
jgi:hypothetical protein